MVLQHSHHRDMPIMDTAMDTDADMHTGPDLTAPPCPVPEDAVDDITTTEIPDDQEIDFVTLGMFIIGRSVGGVS